MHPLLVLIIFMLSVQSADGQHHIQKLWNRSTNQAPNQFETNEHSNTTIVYADDLEFDGNTYWYANGEMSKNLYVFANTITINKTVKFYTNGDTRGVTKEARSGGNICLIANRMIFEPGSGFIIATSSAYSDHDEASLPTDQKSGDGGNVILIAEDIFDTNEPLQYNDSFISIGNFSATNNSHWETFINGGISGVTNQNSGINGKVFTTYSNGENDIGRALDDRNLPNRDFIKREFSKWVVEFVSLHESKISTTYNQNEWNKLYERYYKIRLHGSYPFVIGRDSDKLDELTKSALEFKKEYIPLIREYKYQITTSGNTTPHIRFLGKEFEEEIFPLPSSIFIDLQNTSRNNSENLGMLSVDADNPGKFTIHFSGKFTTDPWWVEKARERHTLLNRPEIVRDEIFTLAGGDDDVRISFTMDGILPESKIEYLSNGLISGALVFDGNDKGWIAFQRLMYGNPLPLKVNFTLKKGEKIKDIEFNPNFWLTRRSNTSVLSIDGTQITNNGIVPMEIHYVKSGSNEYLEPRTTVVIGASETVDINDNLPNPIERLAITPEAISYIESSTFDNEDGINTPFSRFELLDGQPNIQDHLIQNRFPSYSNEFDANLKYLEVSGHYTLAGIKKEIKKFRLFPQEDSEQSDRYLRLPSDVSAQAPITLKVKAFYKKDGANAGSQEYHSQDFSDYFIALTPDLLTPIQDPNE